MSCELGELYADDKTNNNRQCPDHSSNRLNLWRLKDASETSRNARQPKIPKAVPISCTYSSFLTRDFAALGYRRCVLINIRI